MSDQGKLSLHKSSSVFNDYLDGDFCDAVIKVEDVEFRIHKVILCSCSSYFRAIFRRWSTPDKKVYDIPGLSPDMMRLIIEFASTGIVAVTKGNAQELLMAADQFNILGIVEHCCIFLEEQLCPENCIGVWQLTNICFFERLQHKAYSFITEHFQDVVSCEEFLQLSVQELSNILGRDDLNVRKESTLFEAIVHWITHKREERKEHITVLLSKVRLALMSEEYIRSNVMSNELVGNSAECLPMLNNAIQTTRFMVTHIPSVSALSNILARPRLPNAILLAIGCWRFTTSSKGIQAFDVRADCWTSVPIRMEPACAFHGTVFLNGCIYILGGCNIGKALNTVNRLDLSTDTWYEVAPMYNRRAALIVTVLDGCIYALGGGDGNKCFRSAERYRPETNQWNLIAPMRELRNGASCTALHNKIYVCGGCNVNDNLQTCECYSPETDQWTMIAPMHTRRIDLGLIAFADHVYAVGGFDGNTCLSSAEAYNPQTNSWHAVSSMMTPRSSFGIEVIDDQLFAVGGFSSFSSCSSSGSVESYDATTDKWSKTCDMETPCSYLCCCVVSKIPNLAKLAARRDTLPFLILEDESIETGDGI